MAPLLWTDMKNRFMTSAVFALLAACTMTSCLFETGTDDGDGPVSRNPEGPLRIYVDPYSLVDWGGDERLLAQHHDHAGASIPRLRAYDRAGYHVVPLMDYSGAPELPFALKTRLWPVDTCVTPDAIADFQNIRLFFPDAEEVGISQRHITSPFLTEYIQYSRGAEDDAAPRYTTEAELVNLIRSRNGLPVAAHPWQSAAELVAGPDMHGMEIYSAYIAAKRLAGDPDFVNEDRNEKLLSNWDAVLSSGRWWVGIAVNDHFGPYSSPTSTDPSIRDSGKILVLARDSSLTEYRDAFERGAFFAIRDNGVTKGGYPTINEIIVTEESISIEANGATDVRWISMGREIGTGSTLSFAAFPSRAVYVRAEILGATHAVYTQPFILRHVDDIDGDGRLTGTDRTLCEDVTAGRATGTPEIVAACAANGP